jgi:MFS transporter, ACS family, tartrate transporter
VHKALVRLLPFVGVCMVFNYLDRVNVGYAALTMNEDLGLSSAAFGFGAGLFFIGYFFFEIPSNLALHRFGARVWIARIMVAWGILAGATAFVDSKAAFYVVRFLLGVAEAGFFPGIILYLTYWFPHAQRAKVLSLFILAVPVSSVLGGPVSTLILQNGEGWFGFDAGWRTMFFIEGLVPVVLGLLCLVFLASRPVDARWLTRREATALTRTLEAEAREHREHSLGHTLINKRVAALAVVYFGIVFGLYSLAFFLPLIIDGLEEQFEIELSLFQIGLVTAIPYGVAAVAMILNARHSDRTDERVLHVAVPVLIGAAAAACALYLTSVFLVVAAISVCAAGVFAALPAVWQLPTAFLGGAGAAAGIALINSFGNLSGFAGPYVQGWMEDLTGSFRAGLWIVAGFMVLAAAMVMVIGHGAPREPVEVDAEEPEDAYAIPAH